MRIVKVALFLRKEEKRASKIVVPPKEMLVSFSIVHFWNKYDVTKRKL